MSEKIELYTREGKPSGTVIERDGINWRAGFSDLYFPIVCIWLRERTGRLLITRRSVNKDYCPGQWENTGGAAQAGEDPKVAVCRELEEETGFRLMPDEVKLLHREFNPDGRLVLTYCARHPRAAVRFQEGETENYAWVRPARIMVLCKNGRMAPPIAGQIYKYFEKLKRFSEKGEVIEEE